MQRYKIKIEYEGTQFVGWQFQKNGQSIQEVLQKAIFRFSSVYGSISPCQEAPVQDSPVGRPSIICGITTQKRGKDWWE